MPCTISLQDQLTVLVTLQDGWYDGEGTKYDRESLERLFKHIESMMINPEDIPYIYPSPDGNVSVEWGDGRSALLTPS